MQAFFYLLRAAAGLPGSSLVLDLSPLVRASKRCQAGTACFMPGARFLCLLPSLPALSASRTGPGATAFDRQPTRKHGGIPNPALVIGGARNDARLGLLLAERGAASGGQASGIISGLEEANWLREKGGGFLRRMEACSSAGDENHENNRVVYHGLERNKPFSLLSTVMIIIIYAILTSETAASVDPRKIG